MTADIEVRAATPDDAAAIAAIYAPFVTDTIISFEETPPDASEMRGRLSTLLDQGYSYLVAVSDGAVVGYAYSSPHRARAAYRWSVDVSVYLAPVVHRQGLGRRLYERLLAEAAGQGYHAAFAGITLPNDASVALHEALGFTHVGTYREVGRKFDKWHDVGWWQRLL